MRFLNWGNGLFLFFSHRLEVEESNAVITCILLICDQMDTFLFDPGSTFSYASSSFSVGLDMICESLDVSIHVYSGGGIL